ncbi:unnamed protein product [Mortierella alpina]
MITFLMVLVYCSLPDFTDFDDGRLSVEPTLPVSEVEICKEDRKQPSHNSEIVCSSELQVLELACTVARGACASAQVSEEWSGVFPTSPNLFFNAPSWTAALPDQRSAPPRSQRH